MAGVSRGSRKLSPPPPASGGPPTLQRDAQRALETSASVPPISQMSQSRLMLPQPALASGGSSAIGSGAALGAGLGLGLVGDGVIPPTDAAANEADNLIGIDEVQKALNRSRASVYRYTNTDPRNLNPPFNPRKLNPEYRGDQKEPLQFHPNEVARFARDVLRIKEVTVEVLNSPSTATQQLLGAILDELRAIRTRLDQIDGQAGHGISRLEGNGHQARPAA